MNRVSIGVAVLVVLGVGSCRLLLPERFAVNAPIASMLFGLTSELPPEAQIRGRLRLPEGFSISVYADGIPPTARAIRFTSAGDLLVSTPRSGGIVLLEPDADGDGRSDGMRELISHLNRPHGIELRSGWLCNVCLERDDRRATSMRVRPDGSGAEVVGRGLRNSLGFDWQPSTGDMYATDNGRDLLGDDSPPCELNRIVAGHFYGWPFANGDRVPDPDFGAGRETTIAASTPPAHGFRAHNAPLGMTFLRTSRVPEPYRGAALVALHGSWNRSEKDGYKVVSLHWHANGRIEERDFAVGFEEDEDVIGRPVDVAEGPDGAIYVSDDYAGVIWRIAYRDERPPIVEAATRPAPRDPIAEHYEPERSLQSARGRSL